MDAFALEFQVNTCMLERQFRELTDTVLNAGGDDKVLRLVLLQDEPHTFHVILGITPVTE